MSRASEKRILDEVNLWMPRLGIYSWHVNVEFLDKGSRGTVAEVVFAPYSEGYREARLLVYVKAIAERTPRQQTLDIIHELRHLHYERINAKIQQMCGVETIVTKAIEAEIETLCDKDALYFYKLYSRRKKRTEG